MVKGFYDDLKAAKKGESIVLNVLKSITTDYEFDDVSNDKTYWHIGDISVYDFAWDCHYYIDVKDDSCISYTGNILAEHRVWYKDSGWEKGFMQTACYDYVAYLSQADKKIYILDFPLWKKHYQNVFKKHKHIPHGGEQTTDAYLMSLSKAKELGIVLYEIDYDFDGKKYYGVNVSEPTKQLVS